MKIQKTTIRQKRIDPKAWYGLKQISTEGHMKHLRTSLPGISNLVNKDKASRDILKTVIIGQGRNRRYRIKGRNLIEFLKEVDNGTYPL